jgi:hypothetical protein
MNERILQLAADAGLTGYFAAETEYATLIPISYEQRKFAELIIKECAIVAQAVDDLNAKNVYQYSGAENIKLHFGVE